jgi:hypothetical protein
MERSRLERVLLVQAPVIGLVRNPDSGSVVFEVFFELAFIKELKDIFNQAVLVPSEVGFVPLEDHREGQGILSGQDPHLRAVDKTGGSQLELEVNLVRLGETDGRT